jgi:hypothetical protein
MKKIILVVIVMVFIATPVFAQRYVNSAEEASKKAKESLRNPHYSSSQIGWLDNVIKVVNINEPAYKDIAAKNNKAIEESKGR